MNWVDLLILGVVIFYLYEGVTRGFIEQSMELFGFIISVLLAAVTYSRLAAVLQNATGIQPAGAQPMAFFILWFSYQLLYSLALKYLYAQVPVRIRQTEINRYLGLVPALLKCLVILAVVLTETILLPVPARLKSSIDESLLGHQFVNRSAAIDAAVSKVLGSDLKQSLTFLTVPAQTEQIVPPNDRVDLGFKTSDVKIDQDSELKMLELINQERQNAGLKTLTADEAMRPVARTYATKMLAEGFFSHQDLEGLSPFDRMEKSGLTFKAAGENIAYAATVDLAHSGLMRSPGHRANILSADFKQVGIGVIDAGIYGKMFVQDFRD